MFRIVHASLVTLLLSFTFAPGALTYAQADGELLVNGDLEDIQGTFQPDANVIMSLNQNSTVIPGWTVLNSEIAWVSNGNVFGGKTPSGAMFLDLTGYHDSPPYGGIAQTISTVPGKRYLVSVSLGANQDGAGYRSPVAISLVAGRITNDFMLNVQAAATGNVWMTFDLDYHAAATVTTITIKGTQSGGGQYEGLDNVSFESPAGVELLKNGSFENPSGTFAADGNGLQSLPPGSPVIPAWSVSGAELVWAPNSNQFGPKTPYGEYFLELTGYHDGLPYGGVTQSVETSPGQQYHLTFALGAYQDVAAYRGPMSAIVTIGSQSNSFTLIPPGSGNQWQTFSYEFQAENATTLIQVTGKSTAGGQYIGIDNVSVVPAGLRLGTITLAGTSLQFTIPEPGDYAIETQSELGVGAWQLTTLSGIPQSDGTVKVQVTIDTAQKHRFFRVRKL